MFQIKWMAFSNKTPNQIKQIMKSRFELIVERAIPFESDFCTTFNTREPCTFKEVSNLEFPTALHLSLDIRVFLVKTLAKSLMIPKIH